ncbi:hypothetical protein ACC693_37935, partial [Rhizobium ruizarguesonis]
IDGWRWGGRIFLVFMLLYTALPMIWMLITSIKSGFAAMQFPPQWWPDQPTLASYQKLLDPQKSVGRRNCHDDRKDGRGGGDEKDVPEEAEEVLA